MFNLLIVIVPVIIIFYRFYKTSANYYLGHEEGRKKFYENRGRVYPEPLEENK